MRYFKPKPGTKSTVHILKTPFTDIVAFEAVTRSLILKNPLGCTSYMSNRKNHLPIQIVREMYTAKFAYLNASGKQIGRGQDTYDSVEGYQTGIAAVISNMANIASHRGKVKHLAASDLFSVLMKCHDPEGGLYFLSLARDRVTLSSYTNEIILKRVGEWTDSVRELS